MLGFSSGVVQSSRKRIDKIRDMFCNDRFCCDNLLASKLERLLRNRSYRIDVVKINTFHFVYTRVDVTGNRDVDDKKRMIQAVAQQRRKLLGCQQRSLRRRRRHETTDLTAVRIPRF